MISVYDSEGVGAAPSNYPLILMQRLKVQGFIVLDYAARYPEAFRALAKLRLEGKWNWHITTPAWRTPTMPYGYCSRARIQGSRSSRSPTRFNLVGAAHPIWSPDGHAATPLL